MAEVICTPILIVLICHSTFMGTSLVFHVCGLWEVRAPCGETVKKSEEALRAVQEE